MVHLHIFVHDVDVLREATDTQQLCDPQILENRLPHQPELSVAIFKTWPFICWFTGSSLNSLKTFIALFFTLLAFRAPLLQLFGLFYVLINFILLFHTQLELLHVPFDLVKLILEDDFQ